MTSAAVYLATLVRRYRLLFMHAGCLWEPDASLSGLSDLLDESRWNVRSVHLGSIEELRVTPEGPGLTIVTGLEDAALRGDRCQLLGRAHAAATAELEANRAVLLVSRAPASALLGCPGSSIIRDAKPVYLRAIESDELRSAFDCELDEVEARRVLTHSAGLPVLVRLLAGAQAEARNQQRAPDFRAVTASVVSRIREALDELGTETVAWLDDRVTRLREFEFREDPVHADELAACRGSGLVVPTDSTTFEVPMPLRAALTRAILDSSAHSARATSLSLLVFEEVFALERLLRALTMDGAQRHHGASWKRGVVRSSSVQSVLLRRAHDDGFAWVRAFDEIPNPLEWMTLTELFDVVLAQPEVRPTSLTTNLLQQMASEMAPVRKRLAHMRLPLPMDLVIARRWLEIVRALEGAG